MKKKNRVVRVHDYRDVYFKLNNIPVMIRDHTLTNKLEVSIYYSDNPRSPIDDADTGSGFYPIDKDKLKKKIIKLYKKKYKKNPLKFKHYTDIKLKPNTMKIRRITK